MYKTQLITHMGPNILHMIKTVFKHSFLCRKKHFKIYIDILFGLQKQAGNQKLGKARD